MISIVFQVNPAPGSGGVVYRYEEWVDAPRNSPFNSEFHVQDIACGIED